MAARVAETLTFSGASVEQPQHPIRDRFAMFGIRRRWPILTGTAAALLYVVNNYELSGLEHLQIQPLQSAQPGTEAQLAQTTTPNPSDPFGFDLTQFGINTAPSLSDNFRTDFSPPQATSAAPAWNQLLSMGEKLALWQDGRSNNASASTPRSARPAFPAASPIPPPAGFVSPTAPLPGTSTTAGTLGLFTTTESMPSELMTGLGSRQVAATAIPPAEMGGTAARPHTIRVASFRLPALGSALLNNPQGLQLLVTILQQYDVVAMQGIQTDRDDILPLIVEQLNQSGRSFDYLIGPRVGRGAPFQQFAYVFDTSRLETDRYQLYSVDDPEDLMSYEPLVAWFRCKGVPAAEAFTFTLINTNINPLVADAERAVLPQLVAAVERDGRQEDDWILLGDFAGGTAQLTMLQGNTVRLAIRDVPTDVIGSQMLDTIIFSARATTEFTGRAGVFDFLRKYNLSLEQALEVSEHMPVWCEFACREGAQPGRIAPTSAFP